MKSRLAQGGFICILSMLVIACGGGGGGPLGTLAGIEGSGSDNTSNDRRISSAGVVTALGSIFVNGVKYEIGGSRITVNGDVAAATDLQVGQVVIVEGTLNENGTTGTATRVSAELVVAGPIERVDLALSRLHVLGQIIEIDANTLVQPGDPNRALGGLSIGDDVAVSAFATAAGIWSARRITPRAASTLLTVTGYVTQLDSSARRFSINGMGIDFNGATLTGFPNQSLSANAPVRVSGQRLDAEGRLQATEVEFRNLQMPGRTGDKAALQGWITRFVSDRDFDVDGHPVITTSATRIEADDVTTPEVSALRQDAFVNVSGKIIANGVVEATLVETNNIITLESEITQIEGSYIYATFVPWSGPRCKVSDATGVTIDGFPATLDQLHTGHVATIYAHHFKVGASNEVDANCQVVEVRHVLRGPLESKPTATPSFKVMGQRVWLKNASAVLDAAQPGDLIAVSGHLTSDGDILATDVRKALGTRNHQLTGLVKAIDSAGSVITIGDLSIDISSAQIGGFRDGGPAVGDRVLIEADEAPVAGLWHADVVRYGAARPRGALANVVRFNGLVTGLGPGSSISVEGRTALPLKFNDQGRYFEQRCDPAKLHLDLELHLTSLGHPEDSTLHYYPPLCPYGRRHDDRGQTTFEFSNDDLYVIGDVQGVDLDKRSVRVAGVDFSVYPGSLLSTYDRSTQTENRSGTTAPVRLQDLVAGQHAQLGVDGPEFANGLRPLRLGWFGDDMQLESDVKLFANYRSFAADLLTVQYGVQAYIRPATTLKTDDCEDGTLTYDNAKTFFDEAAAGGGRLEISANLAENRLVATSVNWLQACPYYGDY